MKNYKLIMVGVLGLLFFSCEKDSTANLSTITFYPDLSVTGDDIYLVPCGATYTEPGIKATENGVEIPVTTTVTGTYRGGNSVDTNVPDKYVINYSATSKDGFDGNAERTVYVACSGDLVTSIEGLYVASVTRIGHATPPAADPPPVTYNNLKYIIIWKNANGDYEMSDAIGAYYELGRALGPAYVAGGTTIHANSIPGNDFTFGGSTIVGTFGLPVTMTSFTVDAANGKIVYVSHWANVPTNYDFTVTLTKVNI